MRRAQRIFAAACVISLLVHLGLMARVGRWWDPPREEVPFPLEASLSLARAPEAQAKAEPPRPVKARPKPARAEPESEMASEPEPAAVSTPSPALQVPEAPGQAAVPEPVAMPEPARHVAELASPAPAQPPEPAPAPRRKLRSLPDKLVLVYKVLAGEGGFNLGEATYTWLARDGRYSLVSVAEATGLASLFMSGRIVQTSEGHIGPDGLLPEQFWLTKNQRRQDTARFDWERRQLTLAQGGEMLRDGTQDLLSFPFHLALTVAEEDEGWILPVTNGRKLRGYRFAVLGRERLEVGDEGMETLHVQGNRFGEGSLDVWLAPSRHWLPVRIRTQDQKGKVVELTLARVSG